MREADTIEYAIRYCITRESYAFADGLDLAEQHWEHLSNATKRDVGDAWLSNDSVGVISSGKKWRWPQIAKYAT